MDHQSEIESREAIGGEEDFTLIGRQFLEDCTRNFGPAPRSFSFWENLTRWRIPKPDWLKHRKREKMNKLFDAKDELIKNGVIVWGYVIQANELLWERGRECCPGEILYHPDPEAAIDPFDLGDIAENLFELRDAEPDDPELADFAGYLNSELRRVYGLAVPSSISPDLPCYASTTFFVRKHLPGRMLCKSLLPIILSPTEPRFVLPLPGCYWPRELLQWWREE